MLFLDQETNLTAVIILYANFLNLSSLFLLPKKLYHVFLLFNLYSTRPKYGYKFWSLQETLKPLRAQKIFFKTFQLLLYLVKLFNLFKMFDQFKREIFQSSFFEVNLMIARINCEKKKLVNLLIIRFFLYPIISTEYLLQLILTKILFILSNGIFSKWPVSKIFFLYFLIFCKFQFFNSFYNCNC